MFFSSIVVPLAIIGLASCVTCGVIAVILPLTFGKLATFLGKWVEAFPTLAFVEKRVDVDHYVLRYTRTFGALVLLASAFWASLLAQALVR
ncbi:MAG: hypothetical protein QGG71_20830 [Pirellulaceae bacterium]|jgi:hypothetical protein|nr:hypothetical protein [Pirellulaceae bacterium]